MARLQIGISGDLVQPSGAFACRRFDVAAFSKVPAIELVFLEHVEEIRPEQVRALDVLVLGRPKITAYSLSGGVRLGLIARFGVGYDRVDVGACSANSVALTIAPDGVRHSVAVAIITLILSLATHLRSKDIIVRKGPAGWRKRFQYCGLGLLSRTLGTIGLGNIGAEMCRLARPFGLQLVAYDPYVAPRTAEALGVDLVSSLDDLFCRADFLAVNCPLTAETRGLVGARLLALMKPHAFLINTARGEIIDQTALVSILREGRIGGAGLDVFAQEPVPEQDPLLSLDNVILAPHSLAVTDQQIAESSKRVAVSVLAFVAGRIPENVVNPSVLDDPEWLVKRARALATVSAS